MTAVLAQIWRHPVKAHGRERLTETAVAPGRALPLDRAWAVAHERSHFDPEAPAWVPCANFTRAVSRPLLQAVTCTTDPSAPAITFRHPERPDLTIWPDTPEDAAAFIDWVRPISQEGGLMPAALVKAEGVAMTDSDFPSISLINLASHRAVAETVGRDLSPLRWRGNFLVEGLEPWVEASWIGKTLHIGDIAFEVAEPITRCRMTEANPGTGRRDADTLGALQDGFGHQDCGIYLRALTGGTLREGAPLRLA